MQCPRRFYYESILGLSTPQTAATAKGTIAHHAFERIFDHDKTDRTMANAIAYVRPAWAMMIDPMAERSTVQEGSIEWRLREANGCFRDLAELGSKDEARHLASARDYIELFPTDRPELIDRLLDDAETAVRGWFAMETPSKFDPFERELYLMEEIAGVTLHGFIDRLDKTVTASGEIRYWISDYKTGKMPSPRFADEAFFQLEVYALLIQATMGVMPYKMRLIYVNLNSKEAVLSRDVNQEMLEKTKKKVKAVMDGIKKSARSSTWEAKKHVLCDWCPFKSICPAHTSGMEGLLPEEIAKRTGTRLK